MNGMPGAIHSGYHTSPQSISSIHAPASSSTGYSALSSSSSSPQSVFGGMGGGAQMVQGTRPSQGLISPLNSLNLRQSPEHQGRPRFESAPSCVQGSVSLDYTPFPHETSYATTTGPTFNQNFGFDQSSHGVPGQQQYHSSMIEMSDESQVGPEQMFGEGSVQPAGGYPCYSNPETQHSRHDTLNAFDDKAPQYSNFS